MREEVQLQRDESPKQVSGELNILTTTLTLM